MVKIHPINRSNHLPGLALESAPPELLKIMHWDLPGDLLKAGSRSTVTRVEVGANAYVFKQYKSLALHRRIRYALTRSRARQSWENGQALADFGLPIIRPIAFFEETFIKVPGRALLIMPFQKGTPLDEYKDMESVAPKLKAVFNSMARHQVTHGDMKASNIIIAENGDPQFIDIDASLIHRSRTAYLKARQKDKSRFLKNWEGKEKASAILAEVFD